MGGNGARSAFMARTLDSYRGVRFKEVGLIDDVKVISVSTQSNTAIPMESFTSNKYYITNPRTGLIDHIAFYDKKGDISHSIDLKYYPDGSLIPYHEFSHKGKLKAEGSHFHRVWPQDENGNKGRTSHNPKNVEPINRYYMRYVNKALEYNYEKINKNGK